MKETLFAALMLVWLLVGCAKPAAPEPVPVLCPPVPQCRAEVGEIRTQAELVQGFTAYRQAFEQCRLYRDTLAACIGGAPSESQP